MLASVVIPTYKRPESVLALLLSLSQQTLPADQYEVIVVDDGSDYDPLLIQAHQFPFAFRYVRKENGGATIARNYGAKLAVGEVLIFIDDDVTVAETAVHALTHAILAEPNIIGLGALTAKSRETASMYTQLAMAEANNWLGESQQDEPVHFSWSNTQLIAVKRDDFFALGLLQDPTGDWPNWDDVDFGYRAHLAGFQLKRIARARGTHWDYSLASLEKACGRWFRACRAAVRLFDVHPGLQPHIPMLHDKTPIQWGADTPKLIIRKLLRRGMALAPMLKLQEAAAYWVAEHHANPRVLGTLYRWIEGSYMYLGYQEGLRQK